MAESALRGDGRWQAVATSSLSEGEILSGRPYADCAFFRSAQRAFASSDNFLRAAALMERRPSDFFGVALGAGLPFHVAQRFFIAAEIRLRAAALIMRRLLGADAAVFDLGGRPRRRAG